MQAKRCIMHDKQYRRSGRSEEVGNKQVNKQGGSIGPSNQLVKGRGSRRVVLKTWQVKC